MKPTTENSKIKSFNTGVVRNFFKFMEEINIQNDSPLLFQCFIEDHHNRFQFSASFQWSDDVINDDEVPGIPLAVVKAHSRQLNKDHYSDVPRKVKEARETLVRIQVANRFC